MVIFAVRKVPSELINSPGYRCTRFVYMKGKILSYAWSVYESR
eukprot:COSAG06_NODE_33359_length_491_cov_0.721939_1_plen_42_part_10